MCFCRPLGAAIHLLSTGYSNHISGMMKAFAFESLYYISFHLLRLEQLSFMELDIIFYLVR